MFVATSLLKWLTSFALLLSSTEGLHTSHRIPLRLVQYYSVIIYFSISRIKYHKSVLHVKRMTVEYSQHLVSESCSQPRLRKIPKMWEMVDGIYDN